MFFNKRMRYGYDIFYDVLTAGRDAMKSSYIYLLFALAIVVGPSTLVQAQATNPQERAGELVQWREHCNDPDPDLRLAYIENAISTNDVSIKRICVRLAAESDNADIRNLGLRAAIASLNQITFSVEMPRLLQDALKKAGNREGLNDGRLNSIYDRYEIVKNGIPMVVVDAAVPSSTSIWYPLTDRDKKDDRFKGTATIRGDQILWVGSIALGGGSSSEATINVKLERGGELKGFFQYHDSPLFPVSAKLW